MLGAVCRKGVKALKIFEIVDIKTSRLLKANNQDILQDYFTEKVGG